MRRRPRAIASPKIRSAVAISASLTRSAPATSGPTTCRTRARAGRARSRPTGPPRRARPCRTRCRASGPGRGRRSRARRTGRPAAAGPRAPARRAPRRWRSGRPRAGRSSRGPPHRRPGCRRRSSRARRRPTPRAGRPGRPSRPSGIPDAMPLADSRMSGLTPQCSTAHIFPVRPAPDWISSAISRIPCSSQIVAQALEEAVLGDDVAALALDRLDDDRRDLVGRRELVEQDLVEPAQVLDPPERRVEDARQQRPEPGVVLGLRRGQRDGAVRPAMERAEERDDVRPMRRVARELDRGLDDLRARVAEVGPGPAAVDRRELRRAACRPRGRSAGRSRDALKWISSAACSLIAATTCGWAWPVELTAMPAAKSRKRLPSMSSTVRPSPRTGTIG